jgi:hypothetical protein
MSKYSKYVLRRGISIEMSVGHVPILVIDKPTVIEEGDYICDQYSSYIIDPGILEALESYSILMESYRKTTKMISELEQKIQDLKNSVDLIVTETTTSGVSGDFLTGEAFNH